MSNRLVRLLLLSLLFFCSFVTFGGQASADDGDDGVSPRRHRVHAALGSGLQKTGIDVDGHWGDAGIGFGLGGGYAYEVSRGAELGAGLTYLDLPAGEDHVQNAVLPWVAIRPHLHFAGSWEFGVSVRGGPSFMRLTNVFDTGGGRRDHLWSGIHGALSPDFRFWLPGDRVALEVAPELLVGYGRDHEPAPEQYLQESAGFAQLGLWLRLQVAL